MVRRISCWRLVIYSGMMRRRNAFRPDWILRLGDIKYTTHKATLMSKSLYMRDAIENSGGAGNTDLSSVLPELCWDAMPTGTLF